ncbi:MAG: DegT/DnrJ/EryC1/StrS family aminotransferase [Holosporales bacterium]|jgi:dTDP-4-amino-4,6-dideoxygalactose transaminase|nr:DegT/DnrJ/EryC1/StrS family aminotransferase [Holosporales bacterium]
MIDEFNHPIPITKNYLPPFEEFNSCLRSIWDCNGQLTNDGPFLVEFEKKIQAYTEAEYFCAVTNGTLALQLALRALGIDNGEIITSPFSYVATVSAILWEHCVPVFVDIDPETLCIDASKIESAVTNRTKAILGVHVYGHPCNIESIDKIAKKHNLPVIYDGAHAFGIKYKEKSLLSYGDVSTCSFHATKLLHTMEGGGVFSNLPEVADRLILMRKFGISKENCVSLGINAKASEIQAVMGLCNLEHIDEIINKRLEICEIYDSVLSASTLRPLNKGRNEYKCCTYYPVIFENEKLLLTAFSRLNEENIFPRRYFYPSLNTLPYVKNKDHCLVSEDISSRIACLPLYYGLKERDIRRIAKILINL